MDGPVIRTKRLEEGKDRVFIKVYAGMHYLRGNSQPHFTVTAETFRNGCWDSGGCQHDLILQHWPELSDLVAMHLSSMDGVPMHAEANAFYQFAGYLGGAGETYHAGNGGNPKTREQCFDGWRQYLRLEPTVAERAAEEIKASWNWPDIRKAHKAFVEAQKERWATEAKACIAKHNLVVFGDKWLPAEENA